MPGEINFVAAVHKTLSRTYQKDRVWFRWSMVGFSIVLVIFLALVGVRLYFVSQLSNLQAQELRAKNEITAQEAVEKEYLLFVKKLTTLTTLFSQRQDKQSAVDFFTQLFGAQIIIRELDYGGTSSSLRFVVEAESIFILEDLVDRLVTVRESGEYAGISTSELRRSENGAYSLKIGVDLAQAEEKK